MRKIFGIPRSLYLCCEAGCIFNSLGNRLPGLAGSVARAESFAISTPVDSVVPPAFDVSSTLRDLVTRCVEVPRALCFIFIKKVRNFRDLCLHTATIRVFASTDNYVT